MKRSGAFSHLSVAVLIMVFLSLSVYHSLPGQTVAEPSLEELAAGFSTGKKKYLELLKWRNETLEKIRTLGKPQRKQRAIKKLSEIYQARSRELVGKYREPFVKRVIRDVNAGLPPQHRIMETLGTPLYQMENGKIVYKNGKPVFNKKHRGWDGDLDLGGSSMATKRLEKVFNDCKVPVTSRTHNAPGYRDFKTTETTINIEGGLGGPGSSAHQTKAQMDAWSKETYASESLQTRDRDGKVISKKPGTDAVIANDHAKKAIAGRKTPARKLLDMNKEGVLQSFAKGTLKSTDMKGAAKLTDAEISSVLKKSGYQGSVKEYRQQLEMLKEGYLADATGLSSENIESFKKAGEGVLDKAQSKTRALAEQEFQLERQRAEEFENFAKRKDIPAEEAKALRQEAKKLREDIMDSKVKLDETTRANKAKLEGKTYDDFAKEQFAGKGSPKKMAGAKVAKASGRVFRGAGAILNIKGTLDDALQGVERAVHEERPDDSTVKTWAKAWGYGVWNASGIPAISELMSAEIKQGFQNAGAEYSKKYKEEGKAPSAVWVIGQSLKTGVFGVGNLLKSMAQGAVEGIASIPGDVGTYLGEKTGADYKAAEDIALETQVKVMAYNRAKDREKKAREKEKAAVDSAAVAVQSEPEPEKDEAVVAKEPAKAPAVKPETAVKPVVPAVFSAEPGREAAKAAKEKPEPAKPTVSEPSVEIQAEAAYSAPSFDGIERTVKEESEPVVEDKVVPPVSVEPEKKAMEAIKPAREKPAPLPVSKPETAVKPVSAYSLSLSAPGEITSGETKEFKITVPSVFSPPYQVEVDFTGHLTVGHFPGKLSGTLSGIAQKSSEAATLKLTVTDSEGRTASVSKRVVIKPEAVSELPKEDQTEKGGEETGKVELIVNYYRNSKQIKERYYAYKHKEGWYVRHGKYESFHKNGNIHQTGQKYNNVDVGKWITIYPSGQKLEEEFDKRGEPHGKKVMYSINGTIANTSWFNHGVQIAYYSSMDDVTYFSDGNGHVINTVKGYVEPKGVKPLGSGSSVDYTANMPGIKEPQEAAGLDTETAREKPAPLPVSGTGVTADAGHEKRKPTMVEHSRIHTLIGKAQAAGAPSAQELSGLMYQIKLTKEEAIRSEKKVSGIKAQIDRDKANMTQEQFVSKWKDRENAWFSALAEQKELEKKLDELHKREKELITRGKPYWDLAKSLKATLERNDGAGAQKIAASSDLAKELGYEDTRPLVTAADSRISETKGPEKATAGNAETTAAVGGAVKVAGKQPAAAGAGRETPEPTQGSSAQQIKMLLGKINEAVKPHNDELGRVKSSLKLNKEKIDPMLAKVELSVKKRTIEYYEQNPEARKNPKAFAQENQKYWASKEGALIKEYDGLVVEREKLEARRKELHALIKPCWDLMESLRSALKRNDLDGAMKIAASSDLAKELGYWDTRPQVTAADSRISETKRPEKATAGNEKIDTEAKEEAQKEGTPGKVELVVSYYPFSKQISARYYGYKENGKYIRHGKYEYFYETGKIKAKGHYNHGNNVGLFVMFYEDGSKDFVEMYDDNGKQHGEQTYFEPDGRKRRIEYYKEGRKHGEETYIRPDGRKSITNYNNGRKHGEQTNFRPDGSKISIINYNNGSKHGEETHFEPDGSKSLIEYYKRGRKYKKYDIKSDITTILQEDRSWKEVKGKQ